MSLLHFKKTVKGWKPAFCRPHNHTCLTVYFKITSHNSYEVETKEPVENSPFIGRDDWHLSQSLIW